MPPAQPPPPAPTEHQLALPLEPVAGPPQLVGLNLVPRRVWRSLGPTLQATARRAVVRVCQEVAHDAVHGH
jgi:hypothetical protein